MSSIETLLADKYTGYVVAAYVTTAVLLGGTLIVSVISAARSRRDLARLEAERKK